jgi:cytochrome c556
MKHISILLLFFSAIGLTACSKPVEDTRPGQPVKTRQVAFKEMLKVFEPMGTMLRTNRYEPEKFVLLATELIAKREAPWVHFSPDTHYPPTKAKTKVWEQPESFEREKQVFMRVTDALLAAARSKDLDNVKKAYSKVYNTCNSCHQEFKNK